MPLLWIIEATVCWLARHRPRMRPGQGQAEPKLSESLKLRPVVTAAIEQTRPLKVTPRLTHDNGCDQNASTAPAPTYTCYTVDYLVCLQCVRHPQCLQATRESQPAFVSRNFQSAAQGRPAGVCWTCSLVKLTRYAVWSFCLWHGPFVAFQAPLHGAASQMCSWHLH